MDTFKFQRTLQLSRKDMAYESIKQAIITGSLSPGDRLRETEIASQMGISRGPVREALNRLAQEGLVVSHPYRETVVAETHPKQVEEVYVPIRRILELYVATHSSEELTDHDFEHLQEIIEAMSAACTSENLDELTNLDMQFHTDLINAFSNATISALWNIIIAKIHARLLYQGIRHDNLECVPSQHQEYLECLKSHDADKIKEHLLTHIY